jgi:hypothetical protein
MDMLVTQPLVIMETPVDAKAFSELSIPLVLLYCTRTCLFLREHFWGCFKALGDYPVVEVECDHEGLFTNPEAYTKGLINVLKCNNAIKEL